ncbi:MAG: YajD family HNH nuclease [Verrucomicrobia bacterium]|nr:YajD family HNH nuclease [Verrucomicrobiota bacterium]
MQKNNSPLSPEQREKVRAELYRDVAERQSGYRVRALKLLPHICASCAREFEGKRLKELTVHHRDHNHNNNPPDGSNWELLCLYCHDHEHEKSLDAKYGGGGAPKTKPEASKFGTPFENLPSLE